MPVPTPALPVPRGPISCEIISALSDSPQSMRRPPPLGHADPLGGDVQLALHVCYELHYRGFRGVDPDWEWDPELIRARSAMERAFLARVRAEIPGGADVEGALDEVAADTPESGGVSAHLERAGTWDEMREYFVHRSIYQLKEADPQAWVIPRLREGAKCALVAVEFDEFGAGRPERVHSTLFENLLRAADLHTGYLGYLDCVPPETLATVNLTSLCGLRRGLRGALVGQFAAAEISTPPSARRLVAALERMHAPPPCVHFYAEHVEADAVHEQVLRTDVVGAMLDQEPELATDVVFGIQAAALLDSRLTDLVLSSWRHGVSSLLAVGRRPEPAVSHPAVSH
ncbi:iron-containing redox enzyme family protein [Rhodococcus sp. NPDC003348]